MNDERLASLSPEQRERVERFAREAREARASESIGASTASGPAPLSFSQEQHWELERSAPGMPVYNVPRAMRLVGALDRDALAATFDELLDRHDVLRTTFESVAGETVATVNAATGPALALVDLRALPPAERDAHVSRELREHAMRPFDLTRDTLLRAVLFALDDDEHALLVVWPHIAADEASARIFFDDFAQSYRRKRDGDATPLPPQAIRYSDFSRWQRTHYQGPRLEALVKAWSDVLLARADTRTRVRDADRAPTPGYAGERRSYRFASDSVTALLAEGRANGASPFVSFFTAFAILVQRYRASSEVVIGTVFSDRGASELERVFGRLSSVLALPVVFDDDPTFGTLRARVRDGQLFALEHRGLPFEKLVESFVARGDVRRAPTFDTIFTLTRDQALALAGIVVTEIALDSLGAKLDLNVGVALDASGVRFDVEYRTASYDGATIDRMFSNFETLIESIVREPTTPVSALPMLGARERALVAQRTVSPMPFRRDDTVVDLLREQTLRTPGASAVECEGASLTYAALDERVRALAAYLRERGVRRGDFVCICVERGIDMIVAILAVVHAGAAYVPIDPSNPPQRVAFVLADAGVALTIVHDATRALVPNDARVLSLDAERAQISAAGANDVADAPSATDLAYVIYTSGSTGVPKGVEIEHRSLTNFVTAMRATFAFPQGGTLLAIAPIAFDIACLDVFAGLASGMRIVVATQATSLDSRALAALIARVRPTFAQTTPSLWQMLVEAGLERVSGLTILCGGEAVSSTLRDRLLACGDAVWNGYGPTEATVYTSLARLTADEPVTIGRTIGNVTAYVLDARGRPLPAEVAGDLYIAGAGVARGYHKREALTASHFVADPFSLEPGARMYRTGDRARFGADGTLSFLGRADGQVKVRGFRIELGEIEAALCAQPEVRSAVVLARANGDETALVAYAIAANETSDRDALAHVLRDRLRGSLPEYMVPSAFAWLDAFPTTGNGKLDRERLAEVAPLHGIAREIESTRTPTELRLAEIWQNVLHRNGFGRSEDFFDLGGNSMLAMRLLNRVRDAFGENVALDRFLESPTIAHLATIVDGAGAFQKQSPVIVLKSEGSHPPFFFLHGDVTAGGHYTRRIARELAPELPFYVLAPPDFAGPRSIRAMASERLADLLAERPHGPYVLGGYSAGGLVAIEMARLLRASGAEVRHVILVDSVNLNAYAIDVARALDAFANLSPAAARFSAWSYKLLAEFGDTISRVQRAAKVFADLGVSGILSRLGPNETKWGPMTEPVEQMLTAQRRYVASPYAGRVTLLMSQERHLDENRRSLRAWHRAYRDFTMLVVPGDHDTCVTDHASAISARFNEIAAAVK